MTDDVREELEDALVAGTSGGVVLGEDEGLTEELRDSFRASGLYRLLR